ncbi:hypothetical protein [Spelaeicoccus albus]|uniref:Membrane-bound ClpP family serine protease n=1 Tax=Spelaeicoccus albus TaxID=1280376 RepID=A0A7Z0AC80_9MICO|nr:hypothetical protein [Spelaeicoccus albus]NYI66516.1 membrane-bound ClpP family serine protease [Spelaeicoccus albus]
MSQEYSAREPVATNPEPIVRTGPRPTTIVWGIILIIIGGGLIVSQIANIHIQAGTALIGILGLAGVLLVVGAVVGAVRSRSDDTAP